jgi:hypothetical protein
VFVVNLQNGTFYCHLLLPSQAVGIRRTSQMQPDCTSCVCKCCLLFIAILSCCASVYLCFSPVVWQCTLQAIGQQLLELDAASCRLASRQLAAVTAQWQPGSHLQVVASSFQDQLREERHQSRAAAAEAAAAALEASHTSAYVEDTATLRSRAAAGRGGTFRSTAIAARDHEKQAEAPAGEQSAAAAADGQGSCRITEQALSDIQQLQQQGSSSSSSNSAGPSNLSRTAGSLARAATLTGLSCVHLYVDALQAYDDDTWQQLFRCVGSIASCLQWQLHEIYMM